MVGQDINPKDTPDSLGKGTVLEVAILVILAIIIIIMSMYTALLCGQMLCIHPNDGHLHGPSYFPSTRSLIR